MMSTIPGPLSAARCPNEPDEGLPRRRAVGFAVKRGLSIGTRSVQSISAPHQQAGNVTAPDRCCSNAGKFLPGRRPRVRPAFMLQ